MTTPLELYKEVINFGIELPEIGRRWDGVREALEIRDFMGHEELYWIEDYIGQGDCRPATIEDIKSELEKIAKKSEYHRTITTRFMKQYGIQ